MPEGHQARKRFGQNFLVDQNIIGKIVTSIAPKPGQHLVEIGPGLGALTRPVLAACCHSWVEIDRDLPFEGTPVMADEEFGRASAMIRDACQGEPVPA